MPRIRARLVNHPTGSMWRGGVQWSPSYAEHDLSEEDAAAVLADHYLDAEVVTDTLEAEPDTDADAIPPCPECGAEWVAEGDTYVCDHAVGCSVPDQLAELYD